MLPASYNTQASSHNKEVQSQMSVVLRLRNPDQATSLHSPGTAHPWGCFLASIPHPSRFSTYLSGHLPLQPPTYSCGDFSLSAVFFSLIQSLLLTSLLGISIPYSWFFSYPVLATAISSHYLHPRVTLPYLQASYYSSTSYFCRSLTPLPHFPNHQHPLGFTGPTIPPHVHGSQLPCNTM